MPAPSSEALYADGFNILTVQSYMAQLYLRKHLNMLHEMFYNPKGELLRIEDGIFVLT